MTNAVFDIFFSATAAAAKTAIIFQQLYIIKYYPI